MTDNEKSIAIFTQTVMESNDIPLSSAVDLIAILIVHDKDYITTLWEKYYLQ